MSHRVGRLFTCPWSGKKESDCDTPKHSMRAACYVYVRVMERQRKRGDRHGFVDHVHCHEDRQRQVGSKCTQEMGTVLLSLLESLPTVRYEDDGMR